MSALDATVVIAMLVVGYWTRSIPRLWIIAGGLAIAVAYVTAQDGRYDDSGGKVGYSILVAAIVMLPALIGRAAAAIMSRIRPLGADPND